MPFSGLFVIHGRGLATTNLPIPNLKFLPSHITKIWKATQKWNGAVLGVVGGHWNWHHSIDRVRFPI